MSSRLIGATFCSGIGTPELACPEIDWRFASEIEKFPRAVLMHKFGMKDARFKVSQDDHILWGDLTTVRVRHLRKIGVPLPEVIVAGCPCQSFSIAGLRKGLRDDRGNITLQFIRTVHAFRNAGSLRSVVYENVPGILSDTTGAFGCLLAGLVGADDPLVPPDAEWGPMCHFDLRSYNVHRTFGWKSCRWPSEGMVEGPLGRAAWRILDAQHFGLAQRRKRLFLVYDTGTGADPSQVLFEWLSSDGYSPSSREARKDVAPTISARTKGGGGLGTDFDIDGGLTAVGTSAGWPAEVAPTLNAHFGDKQGLENQHALEGAGLFVPAAFGGGNTSDEPRRVSAALTAKGQRLDFEVETFVVSGHADYRRGEAPSLRAEGGDVGGGSEALIKEPVYAIQERAVSENPDAGPQGKGYQENLAYTLEARNKVQGVVHALSQAVEQRVVHALCGEGFDASEDGTGRGTPIVPVPPSVYSIMPQNSGKDYKARQVEPSQPVMAGGPVGGNQGGDYVVTPPIPINLQVATRHEALGRGTGFGIGEPGDPAFTISKAHSHGDAVADRREHSDAVFDPNQVTSKTNRSVPQPEICHTLPATSNAPIAFSVRGRDGGASPEIEDGGIAPVVRTPGGGSSQTFIAFSSKDYGADASEELSPTLRSGGHKDSHANAGTPSPMAFNARQVPISANELTPPLDTDGGTIGDTDSAWRVRRLTTVECEALQGLPRNHTLIPWRGNRTGEDLDESIAWLMSHGLSEEESIDLAGVPDGPRYKAIGNGMAKEVIGWILDRVIRFMPKDSE